MGVSGSGKSTVGALLAARLGLPFVEADDYHPPANVAKMAAGVPLDDADRRPWLISLSEVLAKAERAGTGAVLACSALKASYRALLFGALAARPHTVYLHGERDVLLRRLGARRGHFFPPALLDSQLATLEVPTGALRIDVAATLPEVVEAAADRLARSS